MEVGGLKGKRCALTLKYMISEAKKPGAFSQPFQVSNSQDVYIKVVGRKYSCSLGLTEELTYHDRHSLSAQKMPVWFQLVKKSIKMLTCLFLENLFHKATIS